MKHIHQEFQNENKDLKDITEDNGRAEGSKKSRERLLNRLMAGGGVLIAGFTIFYVVTFYGLFSGGKANEADASETTEQMETQPETTEEDINFTLFESPYSDTKISESTKTLLNHAVLGESLVTGIMSVDNRISSVSRSTMGSNMTQYEKVRNVYDYMLYNFRKKESGDFNEGDINALCEGLSFQSEFDMQTAYRADRMLREFAGTSGDYAAAFALVLRKMGYEAYYVDDEIENQGNYEEHGYTVIKIDGEYYIFDLAAEKDEIDAKADLDEKELEYAYFCVALNMAGSEYNQEDVETAIAKFENFATLPAMNFEAMISNRSYSVFGSVTHQSSFYSDGNSDMAEGELHVMMGDTVNLAGTVTAAGADNVWKLTAKIYDRDMNYINEYEIYNQTTSSAYNEVSFSVTEGGYVQLQYSVTDIYDRTCIITHLFKIWTEEDFTTEPVTEPVTENPDTEPQTEPFSQDMTEPADNQETESITETEPEEKTTTEQRESETTTRQREDETEDQTESEMNETTDGKEDETTSAQEPDSKEHQSKQSEE